MYLSYTTSGCTQRDPYPTTEIRGHAGLPLFFSQQSRIRLGVLQLTDGWVMEMWYLCTGGFYSVIKKNKTMQFEGQRVELENISGGSWAQKDGNHVFPPMCRALASNCEIHACRQEPMWREPSKLKGPIRQKTK